MKFTAIIITVFVLKSCANQKAASNMQDRQEAKQNEVLSGTFLISSIGSNSKLPGKMNITFDASKKRASGFAGCNRFFGDYTVEGNTITFGPIATTKMLCNNHAMDAETSLIRGLDQTNRFLVKNGTLQLLKGGTVVVEAKKKGVKERMPR